MKFANSSNSRLIPRQRKATTCDQSIGAHAFAIFHIIPAPVFVLTIIAISTFWHRIMIKGTCAVWFSCINATIATPTFYRRPCCPYRCLYYWRWRCCRCWRCCSLLYLVPALLINFPVLTIKMMCSVFQQKCSKKNEYYQWVGFCWHLDVQKFNEITTNSCLPDKLSAYLYGLSCF